MDTAVADRPSATYDRIGAGYRDIRRPDRRLHALIGQALEGARTVVNVGAGTGSYEPEGAGVTAVEPSQVMLDQHPGFATVRSRPCCSRGDSEPSCGWMSALVNQMTAGEAMAMMEVAVGAVLGAVAGSGLTVFTTYLQMRMKRDEGLRETVRGHMDVLWQTLHEGQQQLMAQRIDDTGHRIDFNRAVMQLAGKIGQQGMVTAVPEFRSRLTMIMEILEEVPQIENRSDDELFQIAMDVISHAQWVCAAFLMNDPLPEEMPGLREYHNVFVRGLA